MFHILKNINVFPDFMGYQADSDSIVISEWSDYDWNVSNPAEYCLTNYVYSDYQSLLKAHNVSDVELFEILNANREHYRRIYCDSNSFATLFIKWITFLFSGMSATTAYTLYCLQLNAFYINQVINNNYTEDNVLVDNSMLISSFKRLSQSTFKKLFKSNRFVADERSAKLKQQIKNYISNEWKVACYLAGDDSFESLAEEHIRKLIVRGFVESIEVYSQTKLFEIVNTNSTVDLTTVDDPIADVVRQTGGRPINEHSIDKYESLYQYLITNERDLADKLYIDKLYNVLHNSEHNSIDAEIQLLVDQMDQDNLIHFVDDFNVSFDRFNIVTLCWILKNRSNSNVTKQFVYSEAQSSENNSDSSSDDSE